jgi:hypothetical protein
MPGSCNPSRKSARVANRASVAELCGEESRIEDYLSEVEGPNAHPVGLETVDYLLNLVGYTLRSGPSITVGEYAVRQGVNRSLSSCPYRESGEDSRTPF